MHTLKFRLADKRDIPSLIELINSAYRQDHDKSWTNESKIVDGDRINQLQLETLIGQQHAKLPRSHLLVAESYEQISTEIIGCIGIEYQQDDVEIGTFCIAPHWQNLGYGQQVLKTAEIYALKFKPDLKSYIMWVLDIRQELIDFYLRRGYERTDLIDEYPLDAGVGEPKLELKLVALKKFLVKPMG